MKLPLVWSLFQNKNDCVCVGGATIADLLQVIKTQHPDLLNISDENIAPLAQDLESWVKAHPHSRKKVQCPIIIAALKKLNISANPETLEEFFIRPLKDSEVLHQYLHNDLATPIIKEVLAENSIGTLWDFIDDQAVYYEEETGDVFTAKTYEKELKERDILMQDFYYVNENGDLIPFGISEDSSEMTLIHKSMREFGISLVKDCFNNDDSITLDDVEAILEFIDEEMPETLPPFTEDEKIEFIAAVKEEIKEGNWEMPPRNLDFEDNADEYDWDEDDDDKPGKSKAKQDSANVDADEDDAEDDDDEEAEIQKYISGKSDDDEESESEDDDEESDVVKNKDMKIRRKKKAVNSEQIAADEGRWNATENTEEPEDEKW